MVTSVDFEDQVGGGSSVLETIWLKLRHRMVVIISMTLFLGGILAVAGQLIPPTYKSTASVIVDGQTPRTIAGLTPDAPFTDNTIGTEISILESRELFEKAVDQMNLTIDPEFNKSLKPSTYDAWKKLAATKLKMWLPFAFNQTAAPRPNTQHFDTVEELRSKVKFTPIPLSRVIDIVVSTGSAERSAQVANTIAQLYVDHHQELAQQIALRANAFLSDQLRQMKQAASAASNAAEEYRVQNGLMLGGRTGGGKDTTLAQETASNINEQLITAQNRLSTLQAAQASARNGNPELVGAVLASPTIARLRDQESLLEGKKAELLGKYGADSQVLMPINGQIAGIRGAIRAEAVRQVKSLDIDVKSAQDTIDRLKIEQTATMGKLRDSNVAQAHLDTLTTEALAAQSMYNTFYAKAKETDALRMFADSSVRIVSNASVSVYPSFPQNRIVVPAALVIALLGSCGFILMVDRRRDVVLSLEDSLDVPLLGTIPLRTKRTQGRYQDAIERLLSRIMRQNEDAPARVVLITSANAQEGKSTVSLSLAEAAVARGVKALLLQADFRSNPPVQRGMRSDEPQIGFSDILRGEAKSSEAMRLSQTTDGQNLPVISTGRVPINPVRLLSGSPMKGMLVNLRTQFELIIIDGPPILAGGDCWVIGENADLTLVLIHTGITSRRDVNDAISDLQTDPSQMGLVFNMVTKDARRRAV
jgi:polysaccharide biosynthesis transport protein